MSNYVFDFGASLGDTIMEKYESLFLFLFEINKVTPIRAIIGPVEISSIFETATSGFENTPIIAKIGELTYAGQLLNKNLPFQLFRSERSAKDELVLIGENGSNIVKFINWIY